MSLFFRNIRLLLSGVVTGAFHKYMCLLMPLSDSCITFYHRVSSLLRKLGKYKDGMCISQV